MGGSEVFRIDTFWIIISFESLKSLLCFCHHEDLMNGDEIRRCAVFSSQKQQKIQSPGIAKANLAIGNAYP